ncbi:FAD-dependent thymidylate synthase [archaeon]|nr:FAD-dependent thymidylate synthase [archaeon]
MAPRSAGEFTHEEARIIEPYFTNIDKPVFALKNLPEVVKGALFSRYSRSANSLRRTLLEEFIKLPEMGFSEIVSAPVQPAGVQEIAIKKAEEFYDRVLVGFGDDSVAELAGVHIACEDISTLAAKFIEDSRLGLSPLEKSTRYIYFNDKVNGEYRFYHEPTLMGSQYAKLYVGTCNTLFDTYSGLIEPLSEYLRSVNRKPPETSERAYATSLRAIVCDILRGILPASTLTNLGLYGNGRAFEYLLTKMYAAPLTELRNLASCMQEELDKVIPSFVKRPKGEAGKSAQSCIAQTRAAVEARTGLLLKGRRPEPAGNVELAEFDIDGEERVVTAMLYSNSNLTMQQCRKLAATFLPRDREGLLEDYFKRRQNRRDKAGRALEHTSYTFDLLADYGIYRDLHRHRVLTQERQLLTTDYGYNTPEEIIEANLAQEYDNAMKTAREAFEEMREDFPLKAQYLVPLAYRIRWYMRLNLREVFHLCELRTSVQGHKNYRLLAQRMFKLVEGVHPNLARHMRFVDMNDYELERLDAERRLDRKLEMLRQRDAVSLKAVPATTPHVEKAF